METCTRPTPRQQPSSSSFMRLLRLIRASSCYCMPSTLPLSQPQYRCITFTNSVHLENLKVKRFLSSPDTMHICSYASAVKLLLKGRLLSWLNSYVVSRTFLTCKNKLDFLYSSLAAGSAHFGRTSHTVNPKWHLSSDRLGENVTKWDRMMQERRGEERETNSTLVFCNS